MKYCLEVRDTEYKTPLYQNKRKSPV